MKGRLLKSIALTGAFIILLAFALAYGTLRASLPTLDGRLAFAHLTGAVSIERDGLGIATILADNRNDLAFATGFVHAQDRFFQMDLSRRLAAGELAELFGAAALTQDMKARIFRFRHVAQAVLAQASPAQRALLAAYVAGVNAGLAQLHSRPWEYWLLGVTPQAWREADTILVSYAMWWNLQYPGFAEAMLRQKINASLQGPLCAGGWKCALGFLYPARTLWDSPNDGAPSPSVRPAAMIFDMQSLPPPAGAPFAQRNAAGSNNWALAGRLTATGAALVANDMHLDLRVPTVWYRARLRTSASTAGPALDLNGLTLAGAPLLVAGSNGHIAWGFTNSFGKWLDLVPIACVAAGQAQLRTAQGLVDLTVEHEQIRVKGAAAVEFAVKSGPLGVLYQLSAEEGRCWFARWLAQVPAATNLNLQDLETAASVDAVLALAPFIGIPHQNLIVGDRAGHIAWTLCGRVPATAGAQRLSGQGPWTSAAEQPHLSNPESGRLWTANALPIADERFEALLGGDTAALGADYDLGARARQIRDDLAALHEPATPADMLRVQLDDRALFLARWRSLVLDILDQEALRDQPGRAQFKNALATWNARASRDSVGYRLVRDFHNQIERAVWRRVMQGLGVSDEAAPPPRFEQALWEFVGTRQLGAAAADYASWRSFLLGEVDVTIAALAVSCGELAQCTWGARHKVEIDHPLAGALPLLGRFLNMSSLELPGDHDMPRVQDGSFGASERFAVSPGHEAEGYLHMPGGQSGHPLSPYYRAGFSAWAQGKPLPFLPGSVQHRLTLQPGKV